MNTTISTFNFLSDIPHYVDVLWPVLKLLFIAAVAIFALTACGGGGGGGKSIADNTREIHLAGKTQVSAWETHPTYQKTAIANPQTPTGDPSLDEPGTGTRDSRGTSMANVLSANNASFDGRTLRSVESENLNAFKEGWTGQGSDVLLLDSFQREPKESISHGEIVRGVIATRSPGARITSVDVIGKDPSSAFMVQETGVSGNNVGLIDRTASLTGQPIYYKAVNLSFGDAQSQVFTPTQAVARNQDVLGMLNTTNHAMTQGGHVNTINVRDAVISKAAGNSSATAQHDSLNVALMTDASTKDRTILVGAKHGDQFASYSNTCGNYCNQFVVAEGSSPYAGDSSVGTSFAAPRVTAIAAVVRQKFSNINAERAAEVILKTADKSGIQGYDYNIHGMGVASMARALSPIGNLR